MPFDRFVAAAQVAARKVYPSGDYSRPIDFGRHGELNAWAPTVDGSILPEHPFWTSAPAASAGVPLIVGSTLTEFGIGFLNPDFEKLTIDELRDRIVKGHGPEHGPRILEAFRRGHPDASPAKLFAIWFSSGARHAAVRQAALKAAQGGAPAYLYWFAWDSPVLDGRLHSFHCSEMPFVFDNTDRCDHMTGGGLEARALAARISSAWVQFARTGNPNHGGLPPWPAFDAGRRSTDDLRRHLRGEGRSRRRRAEGPGRLDEVDLGPPCSPSRSDCARPGLSRPQALISTPLRTYCRSSTCFSRKAATSARDTVGRPRSARCSPAR